MSYQVSTLSHSLHDVEEQLSSAVAEISKLQAELQVRREGKICFFLAIEWAVK